MTEDYCRRCLLPLDTASGDYCDACRERLAEAPVEVVEVESLDGEATA